MSSKSKMKKTEEGTKEQQGDKEGKRRTREGAKTDQRGDKGRGTQGGDKGTKGGDRDKGSSLPSLLPLHEHGPH